MWYHWWKIFKLNLWIFFWLFSLNLLLFLMIYIQFCGCVFYIIDTQNIWSLEYGLHLVGFCCFYRLGRLCFLFIQYLDDVHWPSERHFTSNQSQIFCRYSWYLFTYLIYLPCHGQVIKTFSSSLNCRHLRASCGVSNSSPGFTALLVLLVIY